MHCHLQKAIDAPHMHPQPGSTMTNQEERLHQHVTADDIARYQADGVVMIRAVLDARWIDALRVGVEGVLDSLGTHSNEYETSGKGRFAQDMFMWKRNDRIGDIFRDTVMYSPLAAVAGELMQSQEISFIYDQMFVKEPGTANPTPWHQDLPYWPFKGDQICGIWCPLDPVDLASGGMKYVKGSHRSGKWYAPRHFGGDDNAYEGAQGDVMPGIEKLARPDELASWEMNPGDCIVFHGLTIHGSGGNTSLSRRRRAVSLRWGGDDVRYDARPGTYPFPNHGLSDGQALGATADYPLVWRRTSK
jgi:ectoine hydroxylase-related dioxygenase (phytanoyl-CoA dioxygenase family)